MPDSRIHFEAFGTAIAKRESIKVLFDTAQTKTINTGIIINFTELDKMILWSPVANNLVDFSEANGLSTNSGCHDVSCGNYQIRILSEEVAYSQSPDFKRVSGKCLLSVLTPDTILTLAG